MANWKEKLKVMSRYDLTAKMYDERYAEEQVAKYKAALKEVDTAKTTVLDVGCGSGLLFNFIAVKAKTVLGVDISGKLLEQAKQNAKNFQNVSVVRADADNLPFKNGFFDEIFAFTILQNMPKPAQTLIEFRRVSKAEGKVVVTGLKKAFPLDSFYDLANSEGFKVVSFVDDEGLKCYVAVLASICTSAT